ncbi:TetR/AcrR family transcriptional regulator [Hydrogenophaga sp. PBL-H3]|uniref:TetR/AcrR family transcriptional regulator n=1 Tax=Hydrogenophaga sp. PBL-H3 TaxID=434010 RepID=UPI001320181C|nr:TetR/AcrR family transcriptional regulator [Hydrogenophaga sp. PBL-H3]QHE75210.1 TetR/AcrR family transcriptional regulator [Hydrogenophaga sp. PBL-H3]QHE79637.1 TetR/AcrR family transcriptional regulator [Hydrogenophaga sp. PBL-H3]
MSVLPVKKSISPRRRTAPTSQPDRLQVPDPIDTRTRILAAAFRCLSTQGYAALSAREIARDAGVNHALINYYFGTKDQLVIAVLDAANQHLLQRQREMYAAPGRFAEKWAQARAFYEDDVNSGFVRLQAELYAASLSNPGLREQFVPRITAWKQVVLEAVREALQTYAVDLPPAFTADALASLISEFWLGMEFARLIGGDVEKARHDQALDAVQQLLTALDLAAARPARTPLAKARQPKG